MFSVLSELSKNVTGSNIQMYEIVLEEELIDGLDRKQYEVLSEVDRHGTIFKKIKVFNDDYYTYILDIVNLKYNKPYEKYFPTNIMFGAIRKELTPIKVRTDLSVRIIDNFPASALYLEYSDEVAIKMISNGVYDYLQHMKDKISYNVYLEGVKINPWIIAFIDNPSDEITNAAIKKNKKVYGYLKNKK